MFTRLLYCVQGAVFVFWSDDFPMKRKENILYQLNANRCLSVASFWSEVFTRALSYMGAVIVAVLILCTTVPGTEEELNQLCIYVSIALAVLWCIPFIRLTRMRLRDAGIGPKAYLWLLLPVLGWIVFGCLMCAKGQLHTPESSVEVL